MHAAAGIGTYPAEGPVNVSWFRTLMRKVEAVWDSALATSFDSHVTAGYKFIMRYYKRGDKIYIFGFSRGAYTARFLARMISHVGLLSMGNEEMVSFAYKLYEEYEKSRDVGGPKHTEHENRMYSFMNHFCRTNKDSDEDDVNSCTNKSGIKVHFLGLFDCVSSVRNLDVPFSNKIPLPAVHGTATHVRHAVAIDERRVKFKAALFSQEQSNAEEDIKEVWFPGNHGDIGGGWHVGKEEVPRDNKEIANDYFQLSDIALKWMVDETDNLKPSPEHPLDRLAWHPKYKKSFLERYEDHKEDMKSARMHDTMTWNGGGGKLKVILWNLMGKSVSHLANCTSLPCAEYIPWVIKRWELVENPLDSGSFIWSYITFPLNKGGRRDIPSTALFHHSVIQRLHLPSNPNPGQYIPSNSLWVQDPNNQLENAAGKATTTPITAGSGQGKERNLRELAKRSSSQDYSDGESEVQALLKTEPVPDIKFVLASDLTNGSVAVKGKHVEEWYGIYRVVPNPDKAKRSRHAAWR